MSEEHKKYEIKMIEDLLTMPEDKIDKCLSDLREWYDFGKHLAPLVSMSLIKSVGFTWVDDGIDGVSAVNISIEKGEQQ